MRLAVAVVMLLAMAAACSLSDDDDATEQSTPATTPAPTTAATTAPTAPEATATDPPAISSTVPSTETEPDVAGGTVTIDGAIWSFEAETCTAEGGLRAAGVGADEDGNPAWVDVSVDNSVDFDGDGVLDSSATVVVGVGRTSPESEPVSGQPDWYATTTQTGGTSLRQFDFALDGDHLTGSGTIRDYDAEGPEPVLAELAFDVRCP